jgi:hypothetical protein
MEEENKTGEADTTKADLIPVAEKAAFGTIPSAEIVVPVNVDLKASPLRFLVCLLLSLSLALNGYILTTYVTIW